VLSQFAGNNHQIGRPVSAGGSIVVVITILLKLSFVCLAVFSVNGLRLRSHVIKWRRVHELVAFLGLGAKYV
jgi:threonine/homoserine/homoserine lactone efflux protein